MVVNTVNNNDDNASALFYALDLTFTKPLMPLPCSKGSRTDRNIFNVHSHKGPET